MWPKVQISTFAQQQKKVYIILADTLVRQSMSIGGTLVIKCGS